MAKRYLTPKEVADELSVSPDTVLRLIGRGDLPAVKVSERLYRIPVSAFERYLAGPVRRRTVVYREVDALPDLGAGEALIEEARKPLARA
jgi:excisionase family DNA binding protein